MKRDISIIEQEFTFLSFKDFLLEKELITSEEYFYIQDYFLPLYDIYQYEYERYCIKNNLEFEEID